MKRMFPALFCRRTRTGGRWRQVNFDDLRITHNFFIREKYTRIFRSIEILYVLRVIENTDLISSLFDPFTAQYDRNKNAIIWFLTSRRENVWRLNFQLESFE